MPLRQAVILQFLEIVNILSFVWINTGRPSEET